MSSFSCPHYDHDRDDCLRLGAECVPGRPGCVLFGNSVFALPWEERLRRKQAERKQAAEAASPLKADDVR